jgi:hypothetical protein
MVTLPKWPAWRWSAIAGTAALSAVIVSGILNAHSWGWGDFPDWVTAIATAGLFAGAGFTVYYARTAFEEQSKELGVLQQQAAGQQELTRQQGELLAVQSGRLELQQRQFDAQRKINAQQAGVLELQARELQESLDERKHDREQRRRAQAADVYITREEFAGNRALLGSGGLAGRSARPPAIIAAVHNAGTRPVYDVRVHWVDVSSGTKPGERSRAAPLALIATRKQSEKSLPRSR